MIEAFYRFKCWFASQSMKPPELVLDAAEYERLGWQISKECLMPWSPSTESFLFMGFIIRKRAEFRLPMPRYLADYE